MDSATPLAGKHSFVDLERQRRHLEDNVQQLRKSLQHWQLWEAEYEGLKEEIVSLNEDQSAITAKQLVCYIQRGISIQFGLVLSLM